MARVDSNFKHRVYDITYQIPKGRLMTYGQVAALAGAAWAAWEVGQIAHLAPCYDLPTCPVPTDEPAEFTPFQPSFSSLTHAAFMDMDPPSRAALHKAKRPKFKACPAHDIPWHRVVNKAGGLAKGFPGGLERHKRYLESEGIGVDKDFKTDIQKLLWWPK